MSVPLGFELVALQYPFNQPRAIRINQDHIRSQERIDHCVSFIENNRIDQAEITTNSIDFLRRLPDLKHLRIKPAPDAEKGFDFSPLYQMPEIRSLTVYNVYGSREEYTSIVDYSRINGLISLFVRVNKGTINYQKLDQLKSLRVSAFKGKQRDLSDLFVSKKLDTLELLQCGIQSLDGIETSETMQCLYLSHNRSLSDISALARVKKTLKALRIVNCPKITDFSVLEELENLELLELSGNNTLPNLKFIEKMKSLKTFVFSTNIEDGDLSLCMNLSYAHSSKHRKHYNIPASSLPKNHYYRGNEGIDEWRRLE